jgi:hypothetical protein
MSTEVVPVNATERAGRNQKEKRMNAKYNWLMDNVAIRVTLNTVAFALWMAATFGIMEAAARL